MGIVNRERENRQWDSLKQHWARLAVDYDAQEDEGKDAGEETPLKPRRTLRMGSSGEDVRALQTALQTLGFLNDAADGKFGAKTREAVRKFQKKSGLAVDGIVGAATWAALPEGDGEPSAPTRVCLTGDGMRALILAEAVFTECPASPDGN